MAPLYVASSTTASNANDPRRVYFDSDVKIYQEGKAKEIARKKMRKRKEKSKKNKMTKTKQKEKKTTKKMEKKQRKGKDKQRYDLYRP